MKYALYSGCIVLTEQYGYELSAKSVLHELNVELVDLENFSCCGAPLRNINILLELYLAARNMAVCEKVSLDMLCLCPQCHLAFCESKNKISENSEIKQKIDNWLSEEALEYTGNLKILHVLDLLHDEIGVKEIEKKVKKKINKKIAEHYGCHLIRPTSVGRPDHSEKPKKLKNLLNAIGATTFDYKEKLDCCGAPLLPIRPDSGLTKAGEKLKAVQEHGFDAITYLCPYGQKIMDAKQETAAKTIGASLNLPVLYYTQLLGIALGIDKSKLGLDLNQSNTDKLFE